MKIDVLLIRSLTFLNVNMSFTSICTIIKRHRKYSHIHILSPSVDRCRATAVLMMVICCVLGFVIFTVNLIVLVVFKCSPNMRNSQSIYKISIAIADMLTGITILPTFAINIGLQLFSLPLPPETKLLQRNVSINGSVEITDWNITKPVAPVFANLNKSYIYFIGFFTTLCLMISTYTLLAASFDRLFAVFKPIKYRNNRARKYANILVLGIWTLTLVICVHPFIIGNTFYGVVAGFLVMALSSSYVYIITLYVIIFLLPLLLSWSFSILTYMAAKKHASVRRRLTMNGRTNSRHRKPTSGSSGEAQCRDQNRGAADSTEKRLAKTLSIMIGFFTLSILPIVLCVLALLFGGLRAHQPKTLNITGFVAYTTLEFVAVLFLVCNSLWNFFIYNARNKDFRKAYRKLQQKMRKQYCPTGPIDWSARLQTTFRSNTSTRRTETTVIGLPPKPAAVRTISGKQKSSANTTPVYGRRVQRVQSSPTNKPPSASASPVYGRRGEQQSDKLSSSEACLPDKQINMPSENNVKDDLKKEDEIPTGSDPTVLQPTPESHTEVLHPNNKELSAEVSPVDEERVENTSFNHP